MSDNICIAPRVLPNPEPLTCNLETTPPAQTIIMGDRPVPSLAQTQFRNYRTLKQYQSTIYASAFADAHHQTTSRSPLAALGLGPLALAGCSFNESGIPVSEDSGAPGTPDAAMVDARIDAGNSVFDAGPADAGDAGTGGDATTGCADRPLPGGVPAIHDNAPCGADSILTDLDEGIGVCAHYSTGPSDPANYQLFSWDPLVAGQAMTLNALSFAPDQVLLGTSGEFYITTHGDSTATPAQLPGLAMVNSSLPTPVEQIPFPAIVLPTTGLSSSGRTITQIEPSFPKGLAQVGNQIFVATSNLDLAENDFQPGTVMVYNTFTEYWNYIPTSGYNPTSVAYHGGKIYVVNTGAVDFNGVVTSDSSIDVIHPITHEILENIPLGSVAAGIQGEMQFSPDGTHVYLPTGDNSGRLIDVDLVMRTTTPISLPISSPRSLLTGLSLNESIDCNLLAHVANFNDGKLYSVDLVTGDTVGNMTLDMDTANAEGLSDGLFLGGQVLMGFGSQILAVPLE